MATMTLQQARQKLPNFAVGLGIYARTVAALRDAVMQELEMWAAGDNPLTAKQAVQLKKFLKETQ